MSKLYPVPFNQHNWTKTEERSDGRRGYSIGVSVKPDYDALAAGHDKPAGIVRITYPALVDLLEMAGFEPENSTFEEERARYAE